jgi:hypothetical protein
MITNMHNQKALILNGPVKSISGRREWFVLMVKWSMVFGESRLKRVSFGRMPAGTKMASGSTTTSSRRKLLQMVTTGSLGIEVRMVFGILVSGAQSNVKGLIGRMAPTPMVSTFKVSGSRTKKLS